MPFAVGTAKTEKTISKTTARHYRHTHTRTHSHLPELVDDGDLLLRDIPPALGEERPCKEGRRPYDADFATLHSIEKERRKNLHFVLKKKKYANLFYFTLSFDSVTI